MQLAARLPASGRRASPGSALKYSSERDRRAHVLPSIYISSPSAIGSAASFASHSPMLTSSLAAQTSGHEPWIVWHTKLSMAGVYIDTENSWFMKLG